MPPRHRSVARDVILGSEFRRRREALNLSRWEAARRAQLVPSSIERIECGQVSPTIETLRRYCEALNCTVLDVLRVSESSTEERKRRKEVEKILNRWAHRNRHRLTRQVE